MYVWLNTDAYYSVYFVRLSEVIIYELSTVQAGKSCCNSLQHVSIALYDIHFTYSADLHQTLTRLHAQDKISY